MESHNKKPYDWALAILCCFIWGYCTPLGKLCYSSLGVESTHIPSLLLFAGTRFLIAGAVLIVIKSFKDKKLCLPEKSMYKGIAVVGLGDTVISNACFFIGLASAMGIRTTVMCATPCFIVILFSVFILKSEKFNGLRMLSCVLGFAGIIYMNLGGTSQAQPITFMGEGMVLIACLTNAVMMSFTHEFTKEGDPMTFAGWQMALGGALLIASGLILGGHFNMERALDFAPMLLLALSGSVSFGIWTTLLSRNDASYVTNFKLFEPITGVIVSAILLGEFSQVDPLKCAVALVLVCTGMFLAGRKTAK